MSSTSPDRPTPSLHTDNAIALASGEEVVVRTYGSKKAGEAQPLVVHFHGGAFISGTLDNGCTVANLIEAAGARVVSVAYPLSPEHPFPRPLEIGFEVLQWAFKHRTRLAGKGALVYLAGEEAGGNLAAAVAMVARDRLHPPLAGQVLVAPMLDPCTASPSVRDKVGAQLACRWADGWQQYLRGPMDAEHPYAVPGRAQRLAGLPRALILTAADDAMRDEAIAFAQRLREAGVPVTSPVLGTPSGWPESLEQVPPDQCPCAAEAQEHLRAFLRPPIVPS